MSPTPKYKVDVVIVGAGLSGMILGIELKKRLGLHSFTIYEKQTDVGGTWRDNYYPGCACDVPSHWYSLSTELNPNWTHKFSSQPEIQQYWKNVYQKHNLVANTQLDSTFVSAKWIEKTQGYECLFKRTSTGEEFTVKCNVLVSCIGGFSTPLDKPHGMKGIEDFKGPKFHSARWNYDVDLSGKRVGVIGNGCSATQFIPIISEDKSTEVINFSRSPSWFAPRPQKAYSETTKAIFRNVPGVMRLYRDFIAATSDARYLVWMLKLSPVRHYVEEYMAAYIRKTAPKKYADFLVPSYPFGCKRVIMDPGYLECLHRSNVELVTDGIDTITENGIRGKSGKEYEFDVLILGTGFDVSEVGLGINVTGRNGKTITDRWLAQNGPEAYLGTSISGYPNFYTVLGPNVASGTASVVYSTEAQVNYIIQMIEPMTKYGVKSFECKMDAERGYNKEIQAKLKETVWNGGCTSYYKLGDKVIATYPGTTTEFWWRTRKPVWENFTQRGGERSVALRNRLNQIAKGLAALAALLYVRRKGWKNIQRDVVLFLLMRYQDVMGAVQAIRG
ncbi:FAD/NAD(P)-binding domain-containing protein [Meredithblackwellia eburnea MCA 4105]